MSSRTDVSLYLGCFWLEYVLPLQVFTSILCSRKQKKQQQKNALKHFIVVGGLKTTDFFCHFLEFSLFIKIGSNILTLKKV